MRHDNPVWDPGPKYGLDADVQPFHDAQVAATRPALLLLAACVLGVLVIACVNVANLLLARATARERELSIRAALGGGRARLVRQLLTESLVLSLAGAVLGVVLASAGVRWIVSNLPASVPRTAAIGVNATVLAFTALLSLVVGIAFGLLPAFRATTQRSGAGAVLGVRSASRGMSHARLSGLLVVSEIALAALLAIGAQLLVRSFIELRNVDPGFRPEHLLSARVSPPQGSYQDSAKATALYTQVLARISTLPGVVNAAATTFLPLTRGMNAIALRIQGQYEDVKHGLPMADHFQTVTSTYLATMGIRVLRGRGFTEDDALGQPPVALVSASMAKKFWPNEDAIGKHVGYPYPSEWLTVVGVVPDTKKDSLKDTSDVALYVPFRQRRELIRLGVAPMSLVVRTTGDPAALGAEIRNVVAAIDRSVPVSDVRTMDAVVARSLSKMRFTTALVSAFALTALLLGAVGVFGVMSYVVSQRTQEMGIRVALGATGRDVLALVLGRGAMLAMAGAALGVVAALGAVRPLRSLLYGISARDPLTFATVPLLFVVVALVASYGPARRATRADPVEVLRSD
jgi:predicted permease